MKVLIADDHEIIREGLTRLIDEQSDMVVIGYAENGLDALLKTKSLQPDVLILDSWMPVLTGWDAIHLIHEAVPETKIIMFSMNKKDVYIQKSFKEGAHGYVLKLSPSKEIIDSIRVTEKGDYYLSPVIKKNVISSILDNKTVTKKELRYDLLTNMEQQVFRFIAEGKPRVDITQSLSISDKELDKHKKNIARKINVSDKASMVTYAASIGVIDQNLWVV